MRFLLVCVLLLFTNYLFGAETRDDIDEYFRIISRANRYSPVDGAGSHGGLGVQMGVGAGFYDLERQSPLYLEQVRQRSAQTTDVDAKGSTQLTVPRLYLLKGIVSPLDFGMTYGVFDSQKVSELSGHLQWTVYEAFQMPAIAVRSHFSKVFGLYTTDFLSLGADAVASFGFLRYFNVFGGLGILNHNGRLELSREDSNRYLLALNQQTEVVDFKKTEITKFVGLHIQVIPAVAVLAVEAQESGDRERSYAAKLAFGI